MTIINIPTLAFFYSGTSYKLKQGAKPSIQDIFAKLSLGNLGEAGYSCDEANIAYSRDETAFINEGNFQLDCGLNNIGELIMFGLAGSDTNNCK